MTPFEHGSSTDYAFKTVFIWMTVLAAVVSLKHGKWIPPNVGAILKILFLLSFVVTAGIYAVRHGFAGLTASDFSPTLAGGLLGVTPLLLFSYLGFESGNSAAGEMKRPPGRDVPIAIARSSAIAAAAYLLPIAAILLVVPAEQITGIGGGLMDAVAVVYGVYGSAAPVMMTLTAVTFALVLMTQGSAWMIISDRMQAMAAADGSFFGGFFGRFHPKLGTPPVRVNLLSGGGRHDLHACRDGTQRFCRRGVRGGALDRHLHVPAELSPRDPPRRSACGRHSPDVPRPFKVPVSDNGFRLLGVLCFAWVALGSWVAVFPGTLERLFGLDYDFEQTWGRRRRRLRTVHHRYPRGSDRVRHRRVRRGGAIAGRAGRRRAGRRHCIVKTDSKCRFFVIYLCYRRSNTEVIAVTPPPQLNHLESRCP